jgi:hypothetical protein
MKDAALLEVLDGLDWLEAKHREIIATKHPLIDRARGEVVTDPATGQIVLDPLPARISENEITKIQRMRDELLGVDWGDNPA